MTPGVAGTVIEVTDKHDGALEPQLLLAVTQIFPFDAPTVTLIEVEPCPLVIVQPAGADHV